MTHPLLRQLVLPLIFALACGGKAQNSGGLGQGGNGSGAVSGAASGGSTSSGGSGGAGASSGSAGTAGSSGSSGTAGSGGQAMDCLPQDATSVGGCEPGAVYVFNGIECVGMYGCACAGEDCDNVYRNRDACHRASIACVGGPTTCDDIVAVHDEYISRVSCMDDSDCVVIEGQCGIGLGGCHQVINRHWGAEGLATLGEAWFEAGCIRPVCDCPAPPESAACIDERCVAVP